MRHDENIEHVHFIVSLVETLVTCCIIIVLMLHAPLGYIKVRQVIRQCEHSITDLNSNAHVRSVRMWMHLLVVVGVVYLATCIACFLVFHHLAHLGWTLLSNQVICA